MKYIPVYPVDVDLSEAGFREALFRWIDSTGRIPEVLRIGGEDLEFAQQLLKMMGGEGGWIRTIEIAVDFGYKKDEWSLGDYQKEGYGSPGA